MVKGTTSMGGFTRKHPHIRCRRCGKNSYHVRHHTCASCGFPDAKRRRYSWIKWYTLMQEIEYSFRNEANSLIIERDILTKTIFRVYQKDSNLTKIQRDKLFTRYQHQLAVVVTKIEEIGNTMRNTGTNHSDEGLFTAMEQKLSTMDERLQEISSKISTPIKQAERQTQRSKSFTQQSIQKHRKKATYQPDMNLGSNNHRPLEITTLTQVPTELPEFFRRKLKQSVSKIQHV